MFRTRFRQQIVAEFLPPTRERKIQRLIILCDGMPSIPRKQSLSEFLAAKGFWVIYPRFRGAWESGGEFLERSPHEDILDIIDDLPKEMEEIAFGQRFRLAPDQVFVIGGSFGGAAAILASLDQRVSRVIANCPVVGWKILDRSEKVETSKENRAEITASKVMIFHAKDDPNVPYQRTREFAEITGAKLKSLNRGGHISTDYVVRRYWVQIKKFFESVLTLSTS